MKFYLSDYIQNNYQTDATFFNLGYHVGEIKDEIYIASNKDLSIVVGNSCDSSNEHLSVIKKIENYHHNSKMSQSFKIKYFIPLAHGNSTSRNRIKKELLNNFPNSKYTTLDSFLPINEYLQLLSENHMSVFPQERQQAVGTILLCLQLKHIVLLNAASPVFNKLKNDMRLPIFTFDDFEYLLENFHEVLTLNSDRIIEHRHEIIKEFGRDAVISKWEEALKFI